MLAVDFNTEIVYDRITKDFNLFIEGEYVGSAPTYGEGRYRLDDLVRDKLTHGDHLTATQLDGGSQLDSDDPWSKNPCSTCGNISDVCIGTTFYCNAHEPAEAVNWSIHDIPIEPDPDDGPGEDTDGIPSE